MSTSNEKVLDQVRKLLALAENNDNPNEAAAAAAHAATLMERHSIEEAEIMDVGTDEDIVELTFGVEGASRGRSGEMKSKSTWQGELAVVVSGAFGCAVVWSVTSGFGRVARLKIAGRSSDVKAAIAAKDYCHREIDRLTQRRMDVLRDEDAPNRRSAGIAFRLGVIEAIREAIETERAALREQMRGTVSDVALVVVDERAKKAMESFGKVRRSRANHTPDAMAFMSGRAAGQQVWNGTKQRLNG